MKNLSKSLATVLFASMVIAPVVKADNVVNVDREIRCHDTTEGVDGIGVGLGFLPFIGGAGGAFTYVANKPCRDFQRSLLVANCLAAYRSNPRYAARAGVTCGGYVRTSATAPKPWGPREAFGSMNVTGN